jgi:hypothetical protein
MPSAIVTPEEILWPELKPVSLHALMEQIEVCAPAGICFEDEAPRITALRDVMGDAWISPGSLLNLSRELSR